MRYFLVLILVLASGNLFSQYYFNDIVSTQLANDQFKLLRANKVKKIRATSYEPDNTVTEGFSLEEDISMDGKRSVLTTVTPNGRPSVTNRFYELNKLKRTQSGTRNIDSRTEYTYNEKGQVSKIIFTTVDTLMKTTSTELHEWYYTQNGQPDFMLKIKNRTDTMQIEMIRDELGLVVEEHWKKKGRTLETYYYYYDNNKQLTDVVRFNGKLKKLIPDLQYEYDSAGRVKQLTQVSMGISSYFVWKYVYNEKGLKQTETGFDKDKRPVGRIEYSYEM